MSNNSIKDQIRAYVADVKSRTYSSIADLEDFKQLRSEIKVFAHENKVPWLSDFQNRSTFTMSEGLPKNASNESRRLAFNEARKELITDLMHSL